MKALAFAVLSVVIFSDLTTSDEVVAKLEYGDGDDRAYAGHETDYELPGLSRNLTDALEDLAGNADGIDIFMEALERVVMEGGDTVAIPEEIDPEEHNITLEDAFDRTEDFLAEQMQLAQDLLSETESAVDTAEEESSPVTLELNKGRITDIMESFTDAIEDLRDYRRSQSVEQMYNYYYGDEDPDYLDDEEGEEENDHFPGQDNIILGENEIENKTPLSESTSTAAYIASKLIDPKFIPDLARGSSDEPNGETVKFNGVATKATKSVFGGVVQSKTLRYRDDDDDLRSTTPVNGRLSLEAATYISIACVFFVLSACSVVFCLCASQRSATKDVKHFPEEDRISRISVVPICDNVPSPLIVPASCQLPPLLEVISQNIKPNYDVDGFRGPQYQATGDKDALVVTR